MDRSVSIEKDGRSRYMRRAAREELLLRRACTAQLERIEESFIVILRNCIYDSRGAVSPRSSQENQLSSGQTASYDSTGESLVTCAAHEDPMEDSKDFWRLTQHHRHGTHKSKDPQGSPAELFR